MKRSGFVPLLVTPLLAGPMLVVTGCSNGSTTTTAATAPATAGAATAAGVASAMPGSAPSSAAGGTSPADQKPVPAENNPPGDIPDNLAFVSYTNTVGHYRFSHPEGWLETTNAATAMFSDKLNGVLVMPGKASTPPTVATAKASDLPALAAGQAAFESRGVSAVSLPSGKGVRIIYRRNSAADPVTGRQYRDEVQRYELVASGREIVIELYGPVGADNVDAYRTMVQSLRQS